MVTLKRRKKQRKGVGFSARYAAERKPHRDFQLAIERGKTSYQLELARQRENH